MFAERAARALERRRTPRSTSARSRPTAHAAPATRTRPVADAPVRSAWATARRIASAARTRPRRSSSIARPLQALMWEHVGARARRRPASPRHPLALAALGARPTVREPPHRRGRQPARPRAPHSSTRRSPATESSARTSAPTTRRPIPRRRPARGRPSPPPTGRHREEAACMTDRREIDRIVAAALDEDAPWGDITSETAHPRRRDGHRRARRPRARRVQRRRGVRGRLPPRRPARSSSSCWPRTATPFEAGDVLARVQRARPAASCRPSASPSTSCSACRASRRSPRAYVAETAGTRRPHRRHPQDHARPAQPRAPGRARRRRPQPPSLALRRRDGQGQPPRRAHRGRQDLGDRRAAAPRASGCRTPPTSRSRSTGIDQIDAVLAAGVDTIMLDNFTPDELRRASSSSPAAPWSRPRRRHPRHGRRDRRDRRRRHLGRRAHPLRARARPRARRRHPTGRSRRRCQRMTDGAP